MRKLMKILGIIAIIAIVGLTMVACKNGDDEEEDTTTSSSSGGSVPVIPKATAPAAPTVTATPTPNPATVTITWKAAQDASGYYIYVRQTDKKTIFDITDIAKPKSTSGDIDDWTTDSISVATLKGAAYNLAGTVKFGVQAYSPGVLDSNITWQSGNGLALP